MIIQHFFTPELSINSYLIFDEDKKVGALVDPSRNISDYIGFAKQNRVEITDILETHVHADFLSGSYELKQALNGLPKIHCSGIGGEKWVPDYADIVVNNAQEFLLGNIRLRALATPGHTPEHIVWLAFNDRETLSPLEAVFTGDLLFLGSVGRPDLMGVEAMQDLSKMLYHSLKIISELTDSAKVYPSHGAGSLCGKKINPGVFSTIGYEKTHNPGMIFKDFKNWEKSLMDGMPKVPQYFAVMKAMNLKRLKTENKIFKSIKKDRIGEQLSLNIVIDIRDPNIFAAGCFDNAINIPFGPSFAVWTGSVIPYDKPLLLVVDSINDTQKASDALRALRLIGLDKNVSGYFALSEFNENEKAHYLHFRPLIDVSTLFKNQRDYYILDVRTAKEWNDGHIESAHLIPLTDISKEIHKLPKDKNIAVICHSGNRASIAASMISIELNKLNEFKISAMNVKGGMQAWTNQRLLTTDRPLA